MLKNPRHDWYLEAWLKASCMNQTDLQNVANWSKRKASELMSGKMRYNRDVINDVANALNIRPFELLMPPEEAMHIRNLRTAAADEYQLRVADTQRPFTPAPAPQERLRRSI